MASNGETGGGFQLEAMDAEYWAEYKIKYEYTLNKKDENGSKHNRTETRYMTESLWNGESEDIVAE